MREEIIKLLDQYRLKEALSQMTGYATHTSDWQLKNELEACLLYTSDAADE